MLSLLRLVFTQCGFYSSWLLLKVVFNQVGLYSMRLLFRVALTECDLYSGWSLLNVILTEGGFYSVWSLLSVAFCSRVIFTQGLHSTCRGSWLPATTSSPAGRHSSRSRHEEPRKVRHSNQEARAS